jgi:hypothetical protein
MNEDDTVKIVDAIELLRWVVEKRKTVDVRILSTWLAVARNRITAVEAVLDQPTSRP